MAALIEQARAVREESQRLRAASSAARSTAQEGVARARLGVAANCDEYLRAHELRTRPRPGAWSDLPWLPPDELLDAVLVPVDRAV